MCWACFTSFVEEHAKTSASQRALIEIESFVDGETALGLAGFSAIMLSGWLPRRARWGTLAAGLTTLGGLLLLQQWQKKQESKDNEAEDSPIARIFSTILLYAVRDGARQFRVEREQRACAVSYLIADEWQEQMRIPGYVWPDLVAEAMRRGTSADESWHGGAFEFHITNQTYRITPLDEGRKVSVLLYSVERTS